MKKKFYNGMEIIITPAIVKHEQARKHRKKRINKKWLKRYGLKEIPDDDTCYYYPPANKIFMTKGCYERIKDCVEVYDA